MDQTTQAHIKADNTDKLFNIRLEIFSTPKIILISIKTPPKTPLIAVLLYFEKQVYLTGRQLSPNLCLGFPGKGY